jgi:phosphatidylglycerol:prolipoprotein diacylglycerol transferase
MFFLFYAAFRIVVEGFREPDSAMVAGMTKGQFYSTFMIVAGIAFIAYGWMSRPKGAVKG